jgi:hypothetical protein
MFDDNRIPSNAEQLFQSFSQRLNAQGHSLSHPVFSVSEEEILRLVFQHLSDQGVEIPETVNDKVLEQLMTAAIQATARTLWKFPVEKEIASEYERIVPTCWKCSHAACYTAQCRFFTRVLVTEPRMVLELIPWGTTSHWKYEKAAWTGHLCFNCLLDARADYNLYALNNVSPMPALRFVPINRNEPEAIPDWEKAEILGNDVLFCLHL